MQIQTADKKNKNIVEYLADSPDEKALVEAAYRFGYKLNVSTDSIIEIVTNSRKYTFKKLHVFEFDSVRKRMSVIVEDQEGKIFIYTKGAESELISLITQGKVNETYQHIDDYARQGLRTLVVACREMSKEEYAGIVKVIEEARTSLENRKEKVSANHKIL